MTKVRCGVVSALVIASAFVGRLVAAPLPSPDIFGSPPEDGLGLAVSAVSKAGEPFQSGLSLTGSKNSEKTRVGTNPYAMLSEYSLTGSSLDTAARRSASVFHGVPRGGIFSFTVAGRDPPPRLARFFVSAEPIETVTDQELAAIVTSTDGFNAMPFYIYEAVIRHRGVATPSAAP